MITELTKAQRDAMPGWVEKWTAVGLRTGTLTDDEWIKVEAAARACYRYADLPEPVAFARATSPLAAAVAACVAVQISRRAAGPCRAPGPSVRFWVDALPRAAVPPRGRPGSGRFRSPVT